MKIAYISPEVYPFSKTGGLADVSHAVPKALAKAGHDVCIITPAYGEADKEKFRINLFAAPVIIKNSLTQHEEYTAVFYSGLIPGVKTYFIDYDRYFKRNGLYGYGGEDHPDNAERFAFFAKAAIQCLKETGFAPDIVHCNDWQTGLVPLLLRTSCGNDAFFKKSSIVMTVHNAGYQGVFRKDIHDLTGLSGFEIKDIHVQGGISFLKAGVLYSDAVTTVSRKYGKEIRTKEYGYDMADVFMTLGERLAGIPNAIDDESWNPRTDKIIPFNYSASDLSGKTKCKLELQRRLAVKEDKEIALLGALSRVTYQKGLDVLAAALELLLQDERFQFIFAGSGDNEIMSRYDYLKKIFPERVGLFREYSEDMEHLVEAGLDIFIMPSRYEPCGLSQMYSLKYGTVPVVRATGGLDDAVREWDENKKTGNGFKFNNLTQEELYNTLRKVIKKYYEKKSWKIIQKNGMRSRFSWDDSVKEYEKVYNLALENKFK